MNPMLATTDHSQEKKPFKVGKLRMLIGALALFVTLGCWWAFIIGELGAYEIESGSMEPTMLLYDRVLGRPIPSSGVKVGDIVVINSPDDNGPDLVKRVVAEEGDMVEFRNHHFFVNGTESPPPGQTQSVHPFAPDDRFVLGKDEYYLLGDNRPQSHDSEEFGPVDRANIKKVIFWRYWPPSRMGRITP